MGWDFRDCLRGQGDKTFKGTSVPNSFKCFGKSHPGILHACFVVSHCPVNQSPSSAFGVTGSDDLGSRGRSLRMVVVRGSFRRKMAHLYFKMAVFHPLPILFSAFLQLVLLGCPKYFPGLLYWHSLALAGNHRARTSPLTKKKSQNSLKNTNILQKQFLILLMEIYGQKRGLLGVLRRFWIMLCHLSCSSCASPRLSCTLCHY